MRKWTVVLAAGLAACSGKMPPGPIGKALDLRQYLPDTLRTSPARPDTTYRAEIIVGPDSAHVELTWTVFRHGPGRFLESVSARLVQPVHYDSITVGQVSELKNVASKFEPVESAKIEVNWYKKRFFVHRAGVTPFRFDANGTKTTWPAMGQ